jgi:glucose-1-phosphate cytidylyltransferase
MREDKKSIPVVILCGGMGTRIRDVSENIPKPMIAIGNHPILWHIMKIYSYYDFKDFILCLGYKGEMIRQYFLNYYAMVNDVTVDLSLPNGCTYRANNSTEDWRVTLVDTGYETMTGARVAKIKKYLDYCENFMLTYGDGVSDVDINELYRFHLSHRKMVTVTGVHPVSRFGEMELNAESQVKAFAEKPQVSEGRINGGFFVMRVDFISKYLSEEPDLVLEKQPLMQCARDGELMSFNLEGYWQPMDTYREYQILNNLWNENKAPWKKWR